jgi:hypothetical protein
MKKFFKDYGPAVGPGLAFLLGIIALFIQHTVSIHLEKERALTRFHQLIRLINESPPPKKFWESKAPPGGMISADQARNRTNLARFYNRLLATKGLMSNAEKTYCHIWRHRGDTTILPRKMVA